MLRGHLPARIRHGIFAYGAMAMLLLTAGCTEPTLTATPINMQPTRSAAFAPSPTTERLAGGDPVMTVQVQAPDGALWFGEDKFDGMGGLDPSQQPQGLFRQEDSQIKHYPLQGPVRTIVVGADGAVYAGAGCGVVRVTENGLEELAAVDCDRSTFAEAVFPFDLAFGPDDSLWVAGIFALAHYSDGSWTEYPVRARRLLIAPDGSVWAEGWDGKLDSDCCFVHLSSGEWITYAHDAVLPVDDELHGQIEALLP